MLGLLYWQKEYTNEYRGVYELRGRNSACYSCKTNVLDSELPVGHLDNMIAK